MTEATVAGQASERRGRSQVLVGTVVSARMDKTAVVAVENRVMHELYKRYVNKTSKFYVHDENNTCREGDRVEIVSSRPLSRLKRWRLGRVLRRAEGS